MRKLMEVYEVDNGLLFKRNEKVYHLFSGIENKEVVDSVKIANAFEAFQFLAEFFADKFEVKTNEILKIDTFEKTVQFSLSVKEK